MAFKQATKQNASLKMAISGSSGSGKTFGALLIARGLGGKTAVLDTERGSAALYSDIFSFDTWEDLDERGFSPEFFINVIKEAEKAGYNNLIIDSLSHEWSGQGGCLELVDKLAKSKYRGNSFMAWGEVTPRHNLLIEAILSSRMNIIATMRSKTDYVISKDEKSGRTTPQKVGLGAVQRDGIDYEFTLMLDIDRDSHVAYVSKDRTHLFKDPFVITEEIGERIKNWLSPSKPKPRLDPFEYVKKDMSIRQSKGVNLDSVLSEYAKILNVSGIASVEDLTEEQRRELAKALYIQKKIEGDK